MAPGKPRNLFDTNIFYNKIFPDEIPQITVKQLIVMYSYTHVHSYTHA